MTSNKKLLFFCSGLVLCIFLFTGCSTTSSTEDVNTDVVRQVPTGCVSENDLTVISDEAGTQNPVADNSYAVQWENDEDSLQLVFANYQVDPKNVYADITDGQVLAVVRLGYADNDTPVNVGTYSKVTGSDMTVKELNISTVDLSGGVFDNQATVEITYIGDDYVCGTITATDDYNSSINGDFIAQYIYQAF